MCSWISNDKSRIINEFEDHQNCIVMVLKKGQNYWAGPKRKLATMKMLVITKDHTSILTSQKMFKDVLKCLHHTSNQVSPWKEVLRTRSVKLDFERQEIGPDWNGRRILYIWLHCLQISQQWTTQAFYDNFVFSFFLNGWQSGQWSVEFWLKRLSLLLLRLLIAYSRK